jgi:hypothetical protein
MCKQEVKNLGALLTQKGRQAILFCRPNGAQELNQSELNQLQDLKPETKLAAATK